MTVSMGRLEGPVDFLSVGQFVSGPGWRHMRRTLDSHELVFVRRGVLPIRVGERRMHVAARQLALLPLGVEHAGTETITADLEFFWMHFRMPRSGPSAGRPRNRRDDPGAVRPQTLGPGDAPPQDERCLLLPELADAADGDRLSVMFSQLFDMYAEHGPHSNVYCDYFATSLLLEVSAQERAGATGAAADPGLGMMRSVRSWIRANACEDITVAKVARRFHYSPSYLTALYKRVFGVGIAEQVAECRIDRARELLSSTTSPVADIAREVGYDDPKYFMRVFKHRTGLTPGRYRDAFPARLFNSE